MAYVDDGSLTVDSQPKSAALAWVSAAIWRPVQMSILVTGWRVYNALEIVLTLLLFQNSPLSCIVVVTKFLEYNATIIQWCTDDQIQILKIQNQKLKKLPSCYNNIHFLSAEPILCSSSWARSSKSHKGGPLCTARASNRTKCHVNKLEKEIDE